MPEYERVTDWTEEELALLEELGISPYDAGAVALIERYEEIADLRDRGDPTFDPTTEEGKAFFASEHGQRTQRALDLLRGRQQPNYPTPPSGSGGYAPLRFSQTEAGVRLAWQHEQEEERKRLRGQLTEARVRVRQERGLEDVMYGLARELLPPPDVKTAMKQVRRGEVVKSKLAFQAALEGLADQQEIKLRMNELKEREEAEGRMLRQARARVFVKMVGKDVGRSVLFAIRTSGK